ncbi:DUF1318 domain-containing protein [Desulfovibrio inopinatus]|uniref:DUF1318 domain-containing protein n=1 Tax=Desulfovibrio inopinatus TaxID=102109 RepID=UPI0004000137|nr:DUF1318 domain-containing protein [Desulfovibrio inopinatus]
MRLFIRLFVTALVATLVAACVTVNVYFPEAKVEKAAEQIVNDVYGQDGQQSSMLNISSFLLCMYEYLGPSSAWAQNPATVENATIRSIKNRLANRHSQLVPFYLSGAAGLDNKGFVAFRQNGARTLSLADQAKLRRLVDADNADRRQLYAEVAKAMNLPPNQTSQVQRVFADVWRSKASAGWFVQSNSGSWSQK